MLEEFSNPTILEEQVDQENFVDIMCKNYIDEQIIEKLYKTNLLTNLNNLYKFLFSLQTLRNTN